MKLPLAVLLAGLSTPAVAHDYWLERDGNRYVLYQGHRYSSHQGEERVPYDPAIVQRARCAGDPGTRELPRPAAYPARFDGPCAALNVELSSGYWSQTLTGTVNRPRTDVTGALRSWLSQESIKRVDAWTGAVAVPLARGFELVPLNNPLVLKPGDKLRVQAVWQGQPKAGATIAYDGQPRGVTGADGQLNVRVRHGGTQVVAASFDEPLNDPKADKVLRGAILQFQLPENP